MYRKQNVLVVICPKITVCELSVKNKTQKCSKKRNFSKSTSQILVKCVDFLKSSIENFKKKRKLPLKNYFQKLKQILPAVVKNLL